MLQTCRWLFVPRRSKLFDGAGNEVGDDCIDCYPAARDQYTRLAGRAEIRGNAPGAKGAGEAANMAKYAAGEAVCHAVDTAVQTHGGNGISQEYGIAGLLVASRVTRIAPVSREMILNYVAMHSLGLPKSY